MKRIAFLLLSTAFFVQPSTVFAATIQADENLSITIPVNDDLYAAGGTIVLKNNIGGDVLFAGGDVTIHADIAQDLIVVAGDVEIHGNIGDDIRIAAGTVYLSARVADDVIIMGGEVLIRSDTVIEGDLRIIGGDIVFDGAVLGNVHIRGGSVRMNGAVQGWLDVQADSLYVHSEITGDVFAVASSLSFSDTTVIHGDLHYWQSNGEYDFSKVQIDGAVFYNTDRAFRMEEESAKPVLGIMPFVHLYSLLASSFIIFIALVASKTYFSDAAKRLRKEPLRSVWYGFLYIIVTPFIAIGFFLTVIGVPIGLLVIISYLVTFYFIKPFTALVFARALEQKFKRKWSKVFLFFLSVGILLSWKLVVLLPVIGMLFSALGILAGFGTLSYTEWMKFKKVR
jgi:cytoskeletal protein CcmA (bactofilin family)